MRVYNKFVNYLKKVNPTDELESFVEVNIDAIKNAFFLN